MIRRNITGFDRDQRVVRWALVAAGFALSVGFYAQSELQANAHRTAAEKTAEAQAVTVEDDTSLVLQVVPVVTKTQPVPVVKG